MIRISPEAAELVRAKGTWQAERDRECRLHYDRVGWPITKREQELMDYPGQDPEQHDEEEEE